MRKTLLVVIFSFVTALTMAQSFSLVGYVFSEVDNLPIAGVTVITDDGKTNALTDEQGRFLLQNVPIATKYVSFVLLGYQSRSVTITDIEKQQDLGNISMKETQSAIEEVVITAAAPMAIQKGDTTQYNASAFKANPDADADDLIAKMPGVVIQDGKIQAQGEDIKKVYLDGRLFFSGDPMEALSSIPADAIESIQIFDEISDEEKETGISDSEPTKAINIVTKAKRDKNTILKLDSNAGMKATLPAELHYLVGGNLSFFGKENRLTITGIANNVNSSKFGSNSDPSEENLDAYGNIVGLSQGVKITQGGGVNFSREVSKYKFSASYTFNNVENRIEKTSTRDYYATDSYDSRTLTTDYNTTTYSTMHKLNMRIQYKINDKNSLTFSPEINYQKYSYDTASEAHIVQDDVDVSNTNSENIHTSSTLYYAGSLLYSHSFEKKGRKASLSAYYNSKTSSWSRTQEQTFKETYSSSTGLWTQTAETSLTNKLLAQDSESSAVRLKATWSEPIGKHKLVFSLQYNYTPSSAFKTNDSYEAETGDYTYANEGSYSKYEKIYSSYGAGATYAIDTKKLSLNSGLTVLRPTQHYEQMFPYESTTNVDFVDIQPYLSLKYKVYKKIYVRVYYKGGTVIPDASLMQEVIDDSSTSNLKIGNPNLQNGYKHQFNLYLNKTNVEKSTNFNTSLSFTTISNYITTSTSLASEEVNSSGYLVVGDSSIVPEEGALVTKRINMDGYIWSKANFGYSFTAKPLKSNVNLNLSYAYVRTPSYYYVANYSNVHTTTLRVGLVSNISKNIDFNIYSSTAYNITRNTRLSDYNYLNQTIYMASNFIVWESWVINSELTWRYYQGVGDYWVWNLGIGKKFFKRKNAELRLTVYDLLNQNRNIQRYIKTSYIETVTSNTLGRYVMLKFSYRFNTMSMPQSEKKMKGVKAKKISVEDLKANQELINQQQSGDTK